jgi:hypothetical protein
MGVERYNQKEKDASYLRLEMSSGISGMPKFASVKRMWTM